MAVCDSEGCSDKVLISLLVTFLFGAPHTTKPKCLNVLNYWPFTLKMWPQLKSTCININKISEIKF